MTTGRPAHDWIADFASLAAITGALTQMLPAVATLLAIIWYAILILESRTVQRLRTRPVEVDEETHKLRRDVSGEAAKDALVPEKHHDGE